VKHKTAYEKIFLAAQGNTACATCVFGLVRKNVLFVGFGESSVCFYDCFLYGPVHLLRDVSTVLAYGNEQMEVFSLYSNEFFVLKPKENSNPTLDKTVPLELTLHDSLNKSRLDVLYGLAYSVTPRHHGSMSIELELNFVATQYSFGWSHLKLVHFAGPSNFGTLFLYAGKIYRAEVVD